MVNIVHFIVQFILISVCFLAFIVVWASMDKRIERLLEVLCGVVEKLWKRSSYNKFIDKVVSKVEVWADKITIKKKEEK